MSANPFYALQARAAALIAAHSYFVGLGLRSGQIITEQPADQVYLTEQYLLELDFGIVITTSEGKPIESSYEALITLEELNLSITHNPTTAPQIVFGEALMAAIDAIHGARVDAAGVLERPFDFFAVRGHARRKDAPPHLHVHEIYAAGGARLK